MLKKSFVCLIFFITFFLYTNSQRTSAKEAISGVNVSDIFGETLGIIEIYDNGEIVISYKYGLRRAEVFYCVKVNCDNNEYASKIIVESNEKNRYKNDKVELAIFSYNMNNSLESGEYKMWVDVYLGSNSFYEGTESFPGNFSLTSKKTASTGDKYIYVDSYGINDDGINTTLGKIQSIVNDVVIPVIYIALGLLLVIKGAILGVQIVKNADDPYSRLEKVRALKWLVIGVAISLSATSLVALITGFFSKSL